LNLASPILELKGLGKTFPGVTVLDGDKVVLEGKVRNWDEWSAVENAAWSVPGVKRVEDRLAMA